MKKAVIAVLLCVLAIAIGLFLPQFVSNAKDSKINQSVPSIEAYDANGGISGKAEFSISDKLCIIASADNDFVSINSGKNMTAEDARNAAADFMEMLDDYLEPYEIAKIREESDTFVNLLTADYGAGASFITWTVNMPFDDFTVGFEIDDETRKVIQFTYATKYDIGIPDADDTESAMAIIGMLLADYYGIEFVNVDRPTDAKPGNWTVNYIGSSGNFGMTFAFDNYGIVINEISYSGEEINIRNDAEISIN